jgi:hypothetical protein
MKFGTVNVTLRVWPCSASSASMKPCDQVLRRAVARQRRVLGESVPAAHRDDEVLLVERLRVKAGRGGCDRQDGDIERARVEVGKDLAPGALGRGLAGCGEQLAQADVHGGRGSPQRREQGRQKHRRDAVGSADDEAAPRPGRIEGRRSGEDPPRPRQHVGDRRCELESARRRHDPARRPQKQRIVEQSA